MITGQIQIQQFGYGVGDGKAANGNAIKVLAIRDAQSQLQLNFIFTPAEFEEFYASLRPTKIVPATGTDMKLLR